jgi:hypothetical protein
MVECYVQYGRILYEFVLYRKPEFYETRQIEFRSIRTTTGAFVSWSYGSWIYNHLCKCILPLKLWFQLYVVGFSVTCDSWFSYGIRVCSRNNIYHHDKPYSPHPIPDWYTSCPCCLYHCRIIDLILYRWNNYKISF